MPHQCVKCKLSYFDDAKEALQGCICGSKAFFFVRDANCASAQIIIEVIDKNGLCRSDESAGLSTLSTMNSDPDEVRLQGNIVEEDSCTQVDVSGLLNQKDVIYSPEDGTYNLDLNAVFSGKRPKL